MTTLEITVGERDRLDERTRQRIEAAEEGTELEDASPVLNVGTFDELARLFRPTNLRLLHAIAANDPESISETARLVDRDYRQVHRNLEELEAVGVLDFEAAGAGRPKRPVLPYDGLEIDLPFTELSDLDDARREADAD